MPFKYVVFAYLFIIIAAYMERYRFTKFCNTVKLHIISHWLDRVISKYLFVIETKWLI